MYQYNQLVYQLGALFIYFKISLFYFLMVFSNSLLEELLEKKMEFIIIEFEAYKLKLIIMLELHFLIKNTQSIFRLKL